MYSKFNAMPVLHSKDLTALQRPDCVHLSERIHCTILRAETCSGEDCPFCQTAGQVKNAHQQWSEKLCTVSAETQHHIAQQYYGGRTPWKAEERKDSDD